MIKKNNFYLLGDPNGPRIHILFPGNAPFSEQAIDALICDLHTNWVSLDLLKVLSPDTNAGSIESICPMDWVGWFISYKAGDNTHPFIFFAHPPDLTIEEALKTIEANEEGNLPPSLTAALLAASLAYSSNTKTIRGKLLACFGSIASLTPAQGVTKISMEELKETVRTCLFDLSIGIGTIETRLPTSALDRARFLVCMGEMLWNPNILKVLAKMKSYLGELFPLSWLATSWIYLQRNYPFVVGGLPIALIRDEKQEMDPWIQTLEWEANAIETDKLRQLLPSKDVPILKIPLDFPMNISTSLLEEAYHSTAVLYTRMEQHMQRQAIGPLRIRIPRKSYLTILGVRYLHLIENQNQSLWVGFETVEGMSCSFWWLPGLEFPDNWISEKMSSASAAIIHLNLMALYYDLKYHGLANSLTIHNFNSSGFMGIDWADNSEQLGRTTLKAFEKLKLDQLWSVMYAGDSR